MTQVSAGQRAESWQEIGKVRSAKVRAIDLALWSGIAIIFGIGAVFIVGIYVGMWIFMIAMKS